MSKEISQLLENDEQLVLIDRPPMSEIERQYGYCRRVLLAGIWLMRHGYGRMRLLPYLAPSGCAWRCEFHPAGKPSMGLYRYTSANHGQYLANHDPRLRTRSNIAIQKLVQLIVDIAPDELLECCVGKLDPAYDAWLVDLERVMASGCLPVAFENWSTNDPASWWLTTHPSSDGVMMRAPPGFVMPGSEEVYPRLN